MPTIWQTRTKLDFRDTRKNWLWFQPSRIPTLVDRVRSVEYIGIACACNSLYMHQSEEETGPSSEGLLYHKSHISKHALAVKELM